MSELSAQTGRVTFVRFRDHMNGTFAEYRVDKSYPSAAELQFPPLLVKPTLEPYDNSWHSCLSRGNGSTQSMRVDDNRIVTNRMLPLVFLYLHTTLYTSIQRLVGLFVGTRRKSEISDIEG